MFSNYEFILKLSLLKEKQTNDIYRRRVIEKSCMMKSKSKTKLQIIEISFQNRSFETSCKILNFKENKFIIQV